MELNPGLSWLNTLLYTMPAAYAMLKGSDAYPDLYGIVRFYPVVGGVLVNAEVYGLPVSQPICSSNIFAFHIHEGASCTGNSEDPFADAKMHFNPGGCEHPAHAGDLPPLFADHTGFAWSCTLLNRFKWGDILGRAVVVHAKPDDFTTQPSGNSGAKIACGIITRA